MEYSDAKPIKILYYNNCDYDKLPNNLINIKSLSDDKAKSYFQSFFKIL